MISLFIYNFLTFSLFHIYDLISNSKFRFLQDDRVDRSYRVVNFTKSFLLGISSPYAFYLLYCILYNVEYNIYILYVVSSLYASLDASALLYNKHMQMTTIVHHIVVQLFYYYGVYVDWNSNSVSRLILIYAIFSTFAYLVNYRLAIRKSNISKTFINIINDLSLIIYFLSCITNWTLHTYFIFTTTFVEHYMYIIMYTVLIFTIAFDDVKLMQYLYTKSIYIKKIFNHLH